MTPEHPPAITLPKGGGAIRGIGEKFAASPVTGTGSLSVPLATSPGRAGFGPNLALRYDSGSGNGPFGYGWQLSLPAITRKTDQGLPRYGPDDTFLLSGMEDLVPGAQTPRVVAGREYAVRRYRPRIDGLFARIERWTEARTGEVHWRSVTTGNVTTVYGATLQSRIADPLDPHQVFSWLICETFDDKGNTVVYEYKAEDAAGVDLGQAHEQTRVHRGANRYLKRIRYGNRVSRLIDPSPAQWLFEVVFDYGEHDPAAPSPAEIGPWARRPDPFSTHRPGFEVRTYRMCQRVLMFHHFPDQPGVGADCLVRSTDFGYRADPSASFLESVTQAGYRRRATGGYLRKTMPPVEFGYTEAVIDERIRVLDRDSLANLPDGVDQWVDLDGEGASGIVTEQPGRGWYYKAPLGQGRFAPLRQVATVPSGGEMFADLAGDGQLDRVDFSGVTPGFYERSGGGWSAFRSFTALPNLDWTDPNLRLVDLTGDGHPDVLLTENDALCWYPSLGEEGFGGAQRVRGPRLVFADGEESVYLADMSGDGLTDLVRIRNGEVCYWPSLGYGRFGPKIAMDAAPRFDAVDRFDQQRIRLADIDGSGTTDIVYLHAGGARIYRNRSGNSWAPAHELPFPSGGNVSIVDLMGTGTACLVWSSPLPGDAGRHVRYVDLMGGQKPHLLVHTRNNLGAETRVAYTASTAFFLADKAAGRPWVGRLPFPVHVVESVETLDRISGNRFVSRYTYHHGHFDPVEREFRGFGLIEQYDTEKFAELAAGDLPPVLTKTWFHTGETGFVKRFEQEYYQDDELPPVGSVMPPSLTPDEARHADRALKGSMLRQEVYALDATEAQARPYTATNRGYSVTRSEPGVFSVHPHETVAAHYERGDDPRVGHELVLAVDNFGNVLRSVSIGYGRRHGNPDPEAARQHLIYAENRYTNTIDTPEVYRGPVACETTTWEVFGLVPQARLFGAAELAGKLAAITHEMSYEDWEMTVPARRLIGHVRVLSRRNDLGGPLALGTQESMGLPYESYRLALTPSLVAGVYGGRVDEPMLGAAGYVQLAGHDGWWIPSGQVFYSAGGDELGFARAHFFLPRRYRDPFGAVVEVGYDGYDLLALRVRDPIGNDTTAENDYRVLRPALVTDANQNRTAVAFDALGRAAATAIMGKAGEAAGDTLDGFDPDDDALAYFDDPLADPHRLLQGATTRTVNDLFAYLRSRDDERPRPPARATLARETHVAGLEPGEQTTIRHTLSYSDGMGRELQTRTRDVGRWVCSGWTIFNNKGKPVRRYEPFFSATHRFEPAATVGVSPMLWYDPLGRVVATLRPDHTWEKVAFDPWHRRSWDGNDTVLTDPREDPMLAPFAAVLSTSDYLPTWYEQRINGSLGESERAAAVKAVAHADTPASEHLDSLGRSFLTVRHNRIQRDGAPVDELITTRIALDIEGNQREVIDTLGRCVVRYDYGMDGLRLRQVGMDSGERLTLPDIAGRPCHSWDGRGHRHRTEYDPGRRPTTVFLSVHNGPESVVGRTEYGEELPDAVDRNLRNAVHRVFDPAGVLTTQRRDFKGNTLASTRRFAVEYRETLDWSANPALENETWAGSTEFDALNRPIRIVAPHSGELADIVRPSYNEAGLTRVEVWSRHTADTGAPDLVAVTGIEHDAKGQRTRIEYGNGVVTTYAHDPATSRLRRLVTRRGQDTLQDLTYTYDPSGNITAIRDDAQQTVFFRNQIIEPHADYTYDALYQLIEATGREQLGAPLVTHPGDGNALGRYTERYRYDEVGNLLELVHQASASWTRRHTYAEPSQLEPTQTSDRLTSTRVGDGPVESYRYDVHGNVTEMPHLPMMTWDNADRLRSVALQVSDAPETTYYVYDGGGQRVRKITERSTGTRASERRYLGGIEIHRDYAGNGGTVTLERQTLHIVDGQQRIALLETRALGTDPGAGNLVRFQHGNHLGSAMLELDGSGQIITYEEYHPYGTTSYQAVRVHTETPKRYRYCAKERDAESGLSYHGARYYAPFLARWTACDPAGFVDGTNVYRYARNDPIGLADPTGMASEARYPVPDALKSLVTQHTGSAQAALQEYLTTTPFSLNGTTGVVSGSLSWDDDRGSWFFNPTGFTPTAEEQEILGAAKTIGSALGHHKPPLGQIVYRVDSDKRNHGRSITKTGMFPSDEKSTLSPIEHVQDATFEGVTNASKKSPFLSVAERHHADFGGEKFFIDLDKTMASGKSSYISHQELDRQYQQAVKDGKARTAQHDSWKHAQQHPHGGKGPEGNEALIRGRVPDSAIYTTAGYGIRTVAQGMAFVGIAVAGFNLGYAAAQSVDEGRVYPFAREATLQGASYAAGWLGSMAGTSIASSSLMLGSFGEAAIGLLGLAGAEVLLVLAIATLLAVGIYALLNWLLPPA